MAHAIDKQGRKVMVTTLAAKAGYAQVLVPYTDHELASRKNGNIATSHLQTMRLDNLELQK